uniref:Uncharacterized protein n=1 Tax=Chromera velia CCMP2878 TaxID=1169474 RepID=A0A0G4HG80_9ALVE|eukprot:Cvel_27156.t1-p1 / transcript=Cvel_27156.t1 / gene=Cvel_27156 / organism=Chromera_velia_CCMP2878 / gene_product=hypothetical protein / transcript_product=hypothetical protein / location=Cvel_scaffold3343:2021-3019(+) / protein_length=333 / sequence_SO=supercontig / SO=protein_coding / is_pseudo=false
MDADFNYEDALKAAAGDWEEDSEGRQSMSQGAFIRFLFTLCRLWCHTDSNKDCDREEERERERARGNTDRTETGDGKREAPGSVLLSDASLHLFAPAIRLLLKNYVFFLSGIWLSLSASSPDLCKLRFPPPVPARSRTREREHGGKSWTNSKTRAISSTSSHLALSPFPPLPQVFFESLWRGGTEFQEQLEAARKAAQRAICARESVDKQNRENEKRGEERNTEEVPRPRDHFRGGGGEKEKEKSGVTTTFPSPLTIHWMLLLIEGSADPRIRLSSSSSESPSGATATEKKKTTEKVQGHAEQSPQPLPPSLLRIEQDLFLMLSVSPFVPARM